jgi:hypothetical protein
VIYEVVRAEAAPDPRGGVLSVWPGQRIDDKRPEGAVLVALFGAVLRPVPESERKARQ